MCLKPTTFFLVLGISAAQTLTWEQWIASGTELQAQGKYAEAQIAFRGALEKAEASAERARVAKSLNHLAMILQMRGDFPHAEELYRRALPILETSAEPLNLATGLSNLANLYGVAGQYDKAEPL
ncbi:MAG: tetratricopeptide repeat family protein, partial [Bryobacterales bacterium]|nr:tetratricopeptide repeat family protein [Bryobacterales bacterium]